MQRDIVFAVMPYAENSQVARLATRLIAIPTSLFKFKIFVYTYLLVYS